jgi:hypothetical protein
MARRKKSHKVGKAKTGRRRSHKMGAVNFMEPLGLLAGAIAGNFVKKTLGDKLTIQGKNMSGVAVLAAGIFLPKFVKSPIMKSVGSGMIVSGGLSAISTFVPTFPINGIDMIGESYSPNTISRVDVIGAYTQGDTVVDESMNEYSY